MDSNPVMPERVKILPFRPWHLRRVMEIERASFPADPYPGDLFREFYRKCGGLFLVAKIRGGVGGYIISCLTRDSGAEIVSIAVDPKFRGHGIGARLMLRVLRKLRRARVSRVDLTVRVENGPAIRFYRGLGFFRVRKIKGYYEDSGDGIRMRKFLL